MINNELISYIKQQLSINITKEVIFNNLKSQGWTDTDLNEAFTAIGPFTSPAPIPYSNPDSTPISEITSNATQTQQTISPNPVVQHKSKKIIPIIAILVVLLIAGGVAGYAYYAYHQRSQITLGKVLVNTLDAIRDSKIKSVEFSVSADIDADLTSLDQKTGVKSMEGALPAGVGFSMSWDGILDATVNNNFGSYGKLNLVLKIDDPSGSQIGAMLGKDPLVIELEYYVFSDSVYLKINKVPVIADTYASSQGIPLSKYLNKWFVFNKTEIDLFKNGFLIGFKNATLREGKDFGEMNPFEFNLSDEDYAKIKVALLKYIDQSGVVSIIDRKNEMSGSEKVTALYIKFNKDRYIPALKEFLQDLKVIFPDWFVNLNTDEILDETDFGYSLKTLDDQNMKVFVGSDGYFHGEDFSFKIKADDVMPDISEHVRLDLMNYNKNFNLMKPVNAENFIETFMVDGISNARQKGNEASIKASMSSLRAYAELFWDAHYPNGYAGFCASQELKDARVAIEKSGGTGFVCNARKEVYAIAVKFPGDTRNWCVDSTGASKETATLPSSTACPSK